MSSEEYHFILNLVCVILFGVSICLYCGWIELPDDSYNVTEHIINKKEQYTYKFMDNGFEYFVFTENYCFSVDIDVYNQLSVNDSVVVYVDNAGYGYLCYGNQRFLAE